MKRLLLILPLLILITPLFASEQEPERLALNGKEYGMQYLPLYELDTLLQKQIYKRAGVTVYEYNGNYTFCYWAQQFDLNFGWKRKDKVKIS